ncbi:MAG: caspase family protein, partial [Rubrivivax sp.]|nr:caspase family protein [Pyrinomonadaceae bacterium]
AATSAGSGARGGSGARDVRLFRNGSLVKIWRGDVLKSEPSATLEATVPIVAGENHFTAYAFNHDNVKSADAELTLKGADALKRAGVAYILAVGVNKYANLGYNLKYAVADASEFGAELRRQQERLSGYERVELISLYDGEATKRNILRALADLVARVRPEDALTVYFAGHGTAHENQFYLLPHDLGYAGARGSLDAAGLRTMLAHSISDRELEEAFERVDAGQLLFVIDACNSGQALEAEEKRRGPMNSKGLAQLAYEKGMYILTAAQSYQAAHEAARLGHGFLTYALVEEGLKKGEADDGPRDGELSAREWFDFATARVPKMQEDLMRDAGKRGLNIAFQFGEEGIADPDKRSVQRPRAFYRREFGVRQLIVARPLTITPPASGAGQSLK